MNAPPKKTPVLVAIPMRRFRPEQAAEDLPDHIKAMLACLQASDLPWTFEVMVFAGGNVSRGRNKIGAQFLRGTWKWVSWLDDDILADVDDPAAQGKALADALITILCRKEHVCGGLYTTKEENAHWVLNAYREAEVDSRGLLQVGELGTGGMKTYHRSVFEKLIRLEPELAYICDESAAPEWGFFCQGLMTVDGRRRWLPEDYWLDQLCRKHGIPVWVDTTVRFRHLDVGTGVTYPLDGDWPPLPGPSKPCEPPALAEDAPGQPNTAGSLVIALQFWEGDRAAASRLARFIADLEPWYRHDVELCFVRRHDTTFDMETMNYCTQKMAVTSRITPEHAVGYPASPNAMAFDLMQAAGEWDQTSAVLLMEADCVPVARDWINQLKADWNRAEAAGKLVLGSWRPECTPNGHINGNLLFSPSLYHAVKLKPCPPKKSWDVWWVRYFEPVWMRTGLIANRYAEMYVSEAKLATPECGTKPPVLVHGIKDGSAWAYAQKMTGVVS